MEFIVERFLILMSIVVCIASKTYKSDVYPSKVPEYNTRLDEFTKKPVVSGLMHTLPARSTLSEFRRHLQCASKDPNLNYNNGLVSRMRVLPPNSTHFKSFCSFVEKKCLENWSDCLTRIDEKYSKGGWDPSRILFKISGWSDADLLRVINGSLFYDWPWGIERVTYRYSKFPYNPVYMLINATLSRLSDMRDSAFFTGGADPGVQMQIQVPYFSHCTHERFADIIAPWYNMLEYSLRDYRKLRKAKSDFSEASYQANTQGYKVWEEKVPKAALFSSIMQHRIFMYEQARLHPELIDSFNAYFTHSRYLCPWNPLSDETTCDGSWEPRPWPSSEDITSFMKSPPGFALPLFNVTSNGFRSYTPASYKYVVVPLGRQAELSTSARIIHVMFFSGAVVLLQRSSWVFHFQAQLQPWVHYVPLSFTGADLAEKVQWLQEHDDLARQIAENGRRFARSWMRLEDFYCYTANWLDVMAELGEMTDLTTHTFSPLPYPRTYLGKEFDFPE